jgi:hypothetical protein
MSQLSGKHASRELARIYATPRTAAEAFLAAAKARRDARGGRPVSSIDPVTGRLICTYPDGTVVGGTK